MTVRRACHLILLLLIAAATGCGNTDLVEVKGRVTYHGRPVPNTLVTFLPADESRASNGVTNGNGDFTLTFSRGELGAKRGAHTVILRSSDCRRAGRKAGSKVSRELRTIVAQYSDPKTSGLHFTVTHHGQFIDINLD